MLGGGVMGPAIGSDLLKYGVADQVVVADIDPGRVAEVVGRLGPRRCEGLALDVRDRRALVGAMRGRTWWREPTRWPRSRTSRRRPSRAGVPLAGLTGSAEGFDIFAYHDRAVRAGVTLLPGCGVAPGLTNALVGQGAARFDRDPVRVDGVAVVPGRFTAPCWRRFSARATRPT